MEYLPLLFSGAAVVLVPWFSWYYKDTFYLHFIVPTLATFMIFTMERLSPAFAEMTVQVAALQLNVASSLQTVFDLWLIILLVLAFTRR